VCVHSDPTEATDPFGLGAWKCGACGSAEYCCAWLPVWGYYGGNPTSCRELFYEQYRILKGGTADIWALVGGGVTCGALACKTPLVAYIAGALSIIPALDVWQARYYATVVCDSEICCEGAKPVTGRTRWCFFTGCKDCECPGDLTFGVQGMIRKKPPDPWDPPPLYQAEARGP
jgi:hypothetical protein